MRTPGHQGGGNHHPYLLAVAILIAAGQTLGAEWTTQPDVGMDAQHDSNLRLEPTEEDAVGSLVARAGLDSRYRTETLDLRADIDLKSTSYNEDGYDSDDQRINLSAAQQWEKQSASITVLVDRGSTLSSEFLDSGRINTAERVETFKIAPSWNWSITETSQVSLSGSASKVRYGGGTYTDYRYYDATAQYIYVLREDIRLFANINWSDYESEEFNGSFPAYGLEFDPGKGLVLKEVARYQQAYNNSTRGLGGTVGGEYAVTENLLISAVAGVTETDSIYDVNDIENGCTVAPALGQIFEGLCNLEDDTSTSTLANATLTWQGIRQTFNASYVHQTQPSSDGYVIESQRANLSWKYDLTELSTLIVEGIWGKNKSLGDSATAAGADRSNRDYYYLNLRYRHKLTEEWSVSADYRYRYQERELWQGDSAESNMIALGVTYEWPKTFW